MLNKLEYYGKKKGYFDRKKIKDFDNSSREGIDHIKTKAIDFDKTSHEYSRQHGQCNFRSCDALDLMHSKNKINFIEFKQIDNNENMNAWISSQELPKKIKESKIILLNIVREKGFKYGNKINLFYSCPKNFVISYDIRTSGKDKILTYFIHLKMKYRIKKEMRDNYIQNENFNEPIILKTKDFDKTYPKNV